MNVTTLIAQISERCPGFQGRVAGGLQWDSARTDDQLAMPAAYVLTAGDTAQESTTNVVRHIVREQYLINVALANRDQYGQAATQELHSIRVQLWAALVGFQPEAEDDPLQYSGSSMLLIDENRVVYQFRFFTEFMLGRSDPAGAPETWQEQVNDGLPLLEGVDMDIDFIDPMVDRNLTERGPDGRFEFKTREDIPQ